MIKEVAYPYRIFELRIAVSCVDKEEDPISTRRKSDSADMDSMRLGWINVRATDLGIEKYDSENFYVTRIVVIEEPEGWELPLEAV